MLNNEKPDSQASNLQRAFRNEASTAKRAARQLARLSRSQKDQVINMMADLLNSAQQQILSANAQDLELARQHQLSAAMLDRLSLSRVGALTCRHWPVQAHVRGKGEH